MTESRQHLTRKCKKSYGSPTLAHAPVPQGPLMGENQVPSSPQDMIIDSDDIDVETPPPSPGRSNAHMRSLPSSPPSDSDDIVIHHHSPRPRRTRLFDKHVADLAPPSPPPSLNSSSPSPPSSPVVKPAKSKLAQSLIPAAEPMKMTDSMISAATPDETGLESTNEVNVTTKSRRSRGHHSHYLRPRPTASVRRNYLRAPVQLAESAEELSVGLSSAWWRRKEAEAAGMSAARESSVDTNRSSEGDGENNGFTVDDTLEQLEDLELSLLNWLRNTAGWPSIHERLRACGSNGKPLLPKKRDKKPTMVLDLDETLVHAYCRDSAIPSQPDFVVPVSLDSGPPSSGSDSEGYDSDSSIGGIDASMQPRRRHARGLSTSSIDENEMNAAASSFIAANRGVPGSFRPGAQRFLEWASANFEVVVWTAGTADYAKGVMDVLDPERQYVSHVLSREVCIPIALGDTQVIAYIKDLMLLGRDLSKTFIIDNTPHVATLNMSNLIPIDSFFGANMDHSLDALKAFLERQGAASVIQEGGDVRRVLHRQFDLKRRLRDKVEEWKEAWDE